MTEPAMGGFNALYEEKQTALLTKFGHLRGSPLLMPLACQAAENAVLLAIIKTMADRITALELFATNGQAPQP